MKDNFLEYIRNTYMGPWPSAVLSLFAVIFGGHLLSHLLFGIELLDPAGLIGSTVIAIILIVIALYVKQNYQQN